MSTAVENVNGARWRRGEKTPKEGGGERGGEDHRGR